MLLLHQGRCCRADAGSDAPKIVSTSRNVVVKGVVDFASSRANGACLLDGTPSVSESELGLGAV